MWKKFMSIVLIMPCVWLWLGYPFLLLRLQLLEHTMATPNLPVRALYWPVVLLLTVLFLALVLLEHIAIFHPMDVVPMVVAGVVLLLFSRIAYFSTIPIEGAFTRQFRMISSIALALGTAVMIASSVLWLKKKNNAVFNWKRALGLLLVAFVAYCLDQVEFTMTYAAASNRVYGIVWALLFRFFYPAVIGALLVAPFTWSLPHRANRCLGFVYLAVLGFICVYELSPLHTLLYLPAIISPVDEAYPYLNGLFCFIALWLLLGDKCNVKKV